MSSPKFDSSFGVRNVPSSNRQCISIKTFQGRIFIFWREKWNDERSAGRRHVLPNSRRDNIDDDNNNRGNNNKQRS